MFVADGNSLIPSSFADFAVLVMHFVAGKFRTMCCSLVAVK